MHPLVHDPAFGGKAVLLPGLFDMDQSALPLAEHKVLQGRQEEKVFFGVAHRFFSSRLPAAVAHLLTGMIESFGEPALFEEFLLEGAQLLIEKVVRLMNHANQRVSRIFRIGFALDICLIGRIGPIFR